MEFIAKHRLAALGIGILILALPVIYYLFITADRAGKTQVTVQIVPADAKVTIGDKKVSSGDIWLKPGAYPVSGSKEGFADYSSSEIVGTDKKLIVVLLNPKSDEAKKWAEKNQDKYLKVEGQAGNAAREEGEAFRDKNPIVNILPYKSLIYTIGYRADPADSSGNSIILEINAGESYRDDAVYQIYQWGYDPTDYKINFKDYKNPFES